MDLFLTSLTIAEYSWGKVNTRTGTRLMAGSMADGYSYSKIKTKHLYYKIMQFNFLKKKKQIPSPEREVHAKKDQGDLLTEKQLLSDWNNFQPEETLDDKKSNAFFAEILNKIELHFPPDKKTVFLPVYKWTARAAAIIFLVSGAAWLINYISHQNTPAHHERIYGFEAKRGETKKVVLPDGSVVLLNSESQLSYTSSFGTSNRTVKMEGEAFFSVKHDSLNPFVVKTDKLNTRVLGTQFNIKAYRNDPVVSVSVKKGKVAVFRDTPSDRDILLTKNQKVNYHIQSSGFERETITEPAKAFAWIEGGIVFDNIPIGEAFKQLERDFNVTILCKNTSLKQSLIKGSFYNQNVYAILKMMSISARFNFTIDEDNRTISVSEKNSNE